MGEHMINKRYFANIEDKLREELESWLGTPYRHMSGVKNKGADCIHFVVRILEKFDASQGRNIVVRPYPKDWNLHRGEELLRNEIERQLYVDKIGYRNEQQYLVFSEPIGNGDIILFKFGRLSGHCGIFFNSQVYQTLNRSGVEKISYWSKDFLGRVTTVYKLYKKVEDNV
jgi:cell wall-associated NlpC family hydrolase